MSRPRASRGRASRRRGERAATHLVLLVVVAFVAAALGGLSQLSDAAVARARIDAVADVVALAAVGAGPAAASDLARRNGAALVELVDHGPHGLSVEVARSGLDARASAAEGGEELGDDPGTVDERQ